MRHASFLGVLCGMESVALLPNNRDSQCCAGAQSIHILLTHYIITRIQNNLPIVYCVCRSFYNIVCLLYGSYRLV